MWCHNLLIMPHQLPSRENTATDLSSRECSWPSQRGYSPLTLATTVRGKIYRSCQKHESLSLYHLSTGRHLFGVSFTSLKSNLCTALTTQNTTENNYYLTRTLQPNIFNRNTSVTTHNQRTVGFHQRKQLSRSTAHSSVSISSLSAGSPYGVFQLNQTDSDAEAVRRNSPGCVSLSVRASRQATEGFKHQKQAEAGPRM